MLPPRVMTMHQTVWNVALASFLHHLERLLRPHALTAPRVNISRLREMTTRQTASFAPKANSLTQPARRPWLHAKTVLQGSTWQREEMTTNPTALYALLESTLMLRDPRLAETAQQASTLRLSAMAQSRTASLARQAHTRSRLGPRQKRRALDAKPANFHRLLGRAALQRAWYVLLASICRPPATMMNQTA